MALINYLPLSLPLFVIVLFFMGLGDALLPLTMAFGLSYLTFPLILKLEKWGIKRIWGTLISFLILGLIIFLISFYALPKIHSDFLSLVKNLPLMIKALWIFVEKKLAAFDINIPMKRTEVIEMARIYASKLSVGTIKGVSSFLLGTFSGIVGSILHVINLFLIPVFFFYVIKDYERIVATLKSYLPHVWKDKVLSTWSDINLIFKSFIRGQLIVASILAIFYGISLGLIGIRFGLLVGLLTGLMGLIPYVGFSIGVVLSFSLALLDGSGLSTYIALVAVFGFAQLVEGLFLTPKLVGEKVGLGPLATLLALIVGGNLAGLPGMFLAIPMARVLINLSEDSLSYFNKENKLA